MAERQLIKPQSGYQEKVLSNGADIIISGAAAGVGKTWGLLADPLRDIGLTGFGGVIFRRTTTQIRNEGGLWDTSAEIYPYAGGQPRESYLEWVFKGGQKLKFAHLEHEKNILDWQGSQIPFIGFDELTHFTKKMFFYMLSRNRSVCGVKPYVRATCNPDPESWVYEFIQWWIDPETGLPIPERDGVIRYMMRDGDNYIWGDTVEECLQKAAHIVKEVEGHGIDPKEFVKSVSFISGSIYDNKKLLETNPAYLGNLLAQDEETKAQLLHGNWKVIISDKDIYEYYAFMDCMNNARGVNNEGKYITADIALEGSNKFVVGYWEGWELKNIEVIEKSKGNEVIDGISAMAGYYGVNNRHIIYDADGVGGFVDGFIPGAVPFHGAAAAIEIKDEQSMTVYKENYFNLRAQCYYRSGRRCTKGDLKISQLVQSKMYDDKMTVRQRLMYERKAIKKDDKTPDGKLKIISKDEMKAKLNGDSPDLFDMIMMREYFELGPKVQYFAV